MYPNKQIPEDSPEKGRFRICKACGEGARPSLAEMQGQMLRQTEK